jgi:ABC-type polysaccharide/polyol phosphate transport system ATPase subunit
MRADVLLRADHVSKKFCRSLKRSLWYGVKDVASALVPLQGPNGSMNALRPGEFWAVDDVSFELRRGECLGLIGRNGAGKTTLLKMLNGLVRPDGGRIEIRGRMGALIALGAGFNPILTGRENIYVNASVLGLSKRETDGKVDEIIDFAEISDFIDSPVQNYSSGMQVRLGFAVATALNPDVLLLDEVLAVGDARFRTKCYHRIGQLLKNAAVIYVAHDMVQISRICNEVMVLDGGKSVFQGDPAAGVQRYVDLNSDPSADAPGWKVWQPGLQLHAVRVDPPRIESGEAVTAVVEYTAEAPFTIEYLRCNLMSEADQLAADYDSAVVGERFECKQGTHVMRIPLGRLPLTRGRYRFNLAAFDSSRKTTLFHVFDQPALVIDSAFVTTSFLEMGRIV